MGIDLRKSELPHEIWCGNTEGYREVKTDFRTWIAFDYGLHKGTALFCIFPDGTNPPAGNDWIVSAQEFLTSPVECPHGQTNSSDRIIDIVVDGDYIVAAFQQAYGIDLTDPKTELHWQRFIALLRGIPDSTMLGHIMQWRAWHEDKRSFETRMKDLRRSWLLLATQDKQILSWQEQAFGKIRPKTLQGGEN